MHQNIRSKNKIISSGVYLPPQVVKSDDLFSEIRSDTQYDIPINWMSEKMGITERRMAPPTFSPSDLAIPAAIQALDEAQGVPLQDIDLVVFCGIERDQPEPATAHTIQHSLGLNAKYALDISNACYGFVDGLQMADCYIKSGIVRYALVVTGEIPSRVLRAAVDMLKEGVDIKTARNILGALSVGDAGGAVIVGPAKKGEISGFELFNVNSFSELADKCMYKQHEDGSINGHMNMAQITNAFIRSHHELIGDTLQQLGWSEFDWMLTHQIGQKPFDRLSTLKGVKPSRMIKTLDKLGNITSATFPVNFRKMIDENKAKSGDRIGGCFAGSGLVVGQFGYTF
ncbi:MAG: ketoacyl-ACP synthase III [Acidiferrobacterales bacterium]|nr:ketoacyl-ACP synthase III [Acidiferrobacterales bacterium]